MLTGGVALLNIRQYRWCRSTPGVRPPLTLLLVRLPPDFFHTILHFTPCQSKENVHIKLLPTRSIAPLKTPTQCDSAKAKPKTQGRGRRRRVKAKFCECHTKGCRSRMSRWYSAQGMLRECWSPVPMPMPMPCDAICNGVVSKSCQFLRGSCFNQTDRMPRYVCRLLILTRSIMLSFESFLHRSSHVCTLSGDYVDWGDFRRYKGNRKAAANIAHVLIVVVTVQDRHQGRLKWL